MSETNSAPENRPRHVHIVGSVCLETNKEVFTRLSTTFPTQLHRIPDGETGDRFNFVVWQRESFKPFLTNWYGREVHEEPSSPWTIEPINCRYDSVALDSYKEFCRLRDSGVIQKGVRFQVCLPTPANVIVGLILPKYQVQVEPFYEKALIAAARRIQDSIPKEDLAIQWDMAMDIGLIEFSKFETKPDWTPPFLSDPWFSPVKEGVIERAVRVMKCVDGDVPMGVHLCYGDGGHKHFIEPKDLLLLVELANSISAGIGRDFDWIHVPVPKGRVDDAYFAPLKDLKLGPESELILGLAHAWDLEGTEKRIEVARKFVDNFAISTECGMGRTPKEEFDSVIEVMAAVTAP
ncbi:uncharacterized protein PAC_09213 [Phialocephala subalpina]|uniref:Uncharacterized protein n=1 Tax=Phialocephala subalpina TaxID=576137 RepID=A0A1L7X2T4_9HELO|nr:uncharacterized protein PAC_09213 [Phialocephala subalpina]